MNIYYLRLYKNTMLPVTCVISHITNYLNEFELKQLLSMKEFSEFNEVFNNSYKIKNDIGIVRRRYQTLDIITQENTFLSNIKFFPEIFTLNLFNGMCNLLPFNNLQELTFNYIKYENKIDISTLKNLTKITLTDCILDTSFLLENKFNSLLELNIIKTIKVFEDFIVNFNPHNFKKLEKISFINTDINSLRKLKILCSTLNFLSNLKYLDLSNNDFSQATECALFNYFYHFTELNTLKLSNCKLTCSSIENITAVFNKNNSLKVLHLNGNEELFCCSEAYLHFIEFMSLVSLEELDISNVDDIPENVIFIMCSIQSKSLKKLKMCNCHITSNLCEKLKTLKMDLNFYENLSCGRCKICYDAIKN